MESISNEQLVICIKAGIDVADNMLQLWQQNTGYIAAIAKRFRGYEEQEDLMQQGYLGLCNAVDNYDSDEGVLFMAYARFWIQQSMQRYIEDCGGVVRIPVHSHNSIRKYEKFCRTFELYCGRKPTDHEIQYYLGVGEEKLEQIKKAAQMVNIGSLDVPVGDDEDGSMYDLLPGQESPEDDVVEKMQHEQLQDTLWSMVDELPELQGNVLKLRYREGTTIQETSKTLGVTYNRARTAEQDALRALRRPSRKRRLEPFLPDAVVARAYHGSVRGFNHSWTSSTEGAALKLLREE